MPVNMETKYKPFATFWKYLFPRTTRLTCSTSQKPTPSLAMILERKSPTPSPENTPLVTTNTDRLLTPGSLKTKVKIIKICPTTPVQPNDLHL